jgi:thiamine biosynthesis lipoprotein
MLNRRRFLAIAASCAAASPVWAPRALATPQPSSSVWKGVAMGALASMTLVHPDRAHARAMIERCVAEIERLEAVFSLYRPDSALSRLNAAGELADPPIELVELLSFGLSLAQSSGGAFDPTVQPLLRLYFDHFSTPGAPAGGPSEGAIADSLKLVDFSAVEIEADRIRLGRAGAGITLNGVAQGFVTDRIADLLRSSGFENVLIDLGEGRAIGHRPDGGPWRAAVADPHAPERALFDLTLGNDPGMLPALATSGGYGTRFGPDPLIHHLLDPKTGRSANYYASVSVTAPRATLADGLSTALSILSPARRDALLAAYPSARAWFVDGAGHLSGPSAA